MKYTLNTNVFYSDNIYISKNGKKVSGTIYSYWPNGNIKSRIEINKGLPDGMRKNYDEKANLLNEIPYVSGKKHGAAAIYFPNGKLKCTLPFVNDIVHGNVEIYTEEGFCGIMRYENGKEIANNDGLLTKNIQNTQIEHSNDCPQTYLLDFINDFGEHFEGFGDIWDTIYKDKNDVFVKKLPKIIKKAALIATYSEKSDNNKFNIAYLSWPKSGNVRCGIVSENKNDSLCLASSYPILKGVANDCHLQGFYKWENGIEGEAAVIKDDNMDICFFNHLYKTAQHNVIPGSDISVSLAAIAFNLKKYEPESIPIDYGPMYIMDLCRNLAENPKMDIADYKGTEVSMQKASVLRPSDFACEYSLLCEAEKITEGVFDGQKFYKLYTRLTGVGKSAVYANLYAFESILDGYIPKKGDMISSHIWLSGTIAAKTQNTAGLFTLQDSRVYIEANKASNNDLRRMIDGLSTDPEGNYFLILTKHDNDEQYVQTARDSNGYVIEWQKGSIKRHYRLDNYPASADDVATVFKLFLNNDINKLSKYKWKKLKLS